MVRGLTGSASHLAGAVAAFFGFASLPSAAEVLGAAKPLQSQKRFEQAIRDQSTAPFFILYTIVDDRTGEMRMSCGTANFFRGAIHREYGLPYDPDSRAKATKIMLVNTDHVFHFSKQEALDNMPYRVSQEALSSARKLLDGMSEKQIFEAHFWDDAVGCVLVERGLSARKGDRPNSIRALP